MAKCLCGFENANERVVRGHRNNCSQYKEWLKALEVDVDFIRSIQNKGTKKTAQDYGLGMCTIYQIIHKQRATIKEALGQPVPADPPVQAPLMSPSLEASPDQIADAIELISTRSRDYRVQNEALAKEVQELKSKVEALESANKTLQDKLTRKIAIDIQNDQALALRGN